jgi:hypothetical protein
MENVTAIPSSRPNIDRLNTALWVVQVFLAVLFGILGIMMLSFSKDDLARTMMWPGLVPEWVLRVNGLAELAGALGLLLPSITRIRPKLTVYAGYGLMTVMILAVGFHISYGGIWMLIPNFVLGALAGFVGWGRSDGKAPIMAKK